MGSLNYSSYVHKMEVGLRRNGMHPMAVLLLTSITQYPSVKKDGASHIRYPELKPETGIMGRRVFHRESGMVLIIQRL